MKMLSETQKTILTTACQHPDRQVLPLPANLRGGAAKKVIGSLIGKGMVEEVEATGNAPIWQSPEDAPNTTLVATSAAFEALGIEEPQPEPVHEPKAKLVRKPRTDTKQAKLLEMLRREGGASLDEIVAETSWQRHSCRGAISGIVKKKLGLEVISEKDDTRGRIYRVTNH